MITAADLICTGTPSVCAGECLRCQNRRLLETGLLLAEQLTSGEQRWELTRKLNATLLQRLRRTDRWNDLLLAWAAVSTMAAAAFAALLWN